MHRAREVRAYLPFRRLDGVLAARFRVERGDRAALPHAHGSGEGNERHVARVEAHRLALVLQHADHGELIAVELDGAADRAVGRAKQRLRHIGAQHDDLATILPVDSAQVAAFLQFEVAHVQVVLVGGLHERLVSNRRAHRKLLHQGLRGRHAIHGTEVVHARKVVVAHVAVEQVSRQCVSAESFHLFAHLPVRPVADAHEDDDRRNADDETQHGQSRAQPVAEHSLNGSSRQLTIPHANPFPFPVSSRQQCAQHAAPRRRAPGCA